MYKFELKTKDIMRKYNIRPNKNLGQNFLINEDVIHRIVDIAQISKDDLVIEIGPGLGVLTSCLCGYAGRVVAIELDRKFINILNDVLVNYDNHYIIHADILRIDLKELIKEQLNIHKLSKVKVVANLPYYITTPVVMKLLEDKLGLDSIIVMVQKEVAERMTAKSGNKQYGALTLAINYYGNARMMFDVSSSNFIPPPGVTSTIVKIELDDLKSVNIDAKSFFRVVKAAFAQRRKTIENSLANSGFFNYNKRQIGDMISSVGISPTKRPEELDMEDYVVISKLF